MYNTISQNYSKNKYNIFFYRTFNKKKSKIENDRYSILLLK